MLTSPGPRGGDRAVEPTASWQQLMKRRCHEGYVSSEAPSSSLFYIVHCSSRTTTCHKDPFISSDSSRWLPPTWCSGAAPTQCSLQTQLGLEQEAAWLSQTCIQQVLGHVPLAQDQLQDRHCHVRPQVRPAGDLRTLF